MASKPMPQSRIDAVRATVRMEGGNLIRIKNGEIVELKPDGKYNISNQKYSPRQISEIFSANDAEVIEPKVIEPEPEPKVIEPEVIDITNAEFLTAIFGSLPEDVYTAVCSFPGNPKKRESWGHDLWSGDELPGGHNNYFAIAAIKAGDDGLVARKKANFAGLYCVVLDDIGTKVAGDLRVDPSWVIETSPGNHQVGYLFDTPVAYAEAAVLMKALTTASLLTDTGGQNVVRWVRLPVGINGKLDPPFTCSLKVWEPERRCSFDALVGGLGIDLEPHQSNRKSKKRKASSNVDPGDEVYIPRAAMNPVIEALGRFGLYRSDLGAGKHSITCPWVEEHTDQVDSGTAYFEPDDNFQRGGFKCHHGHCSERNIGDLLTILGVPSAAAKHKPSFYVSGGTLHLQVANAEKVLADTGLYFEQGGAIVSVVTPSGGKTSAKHIRKDALPCILTGLASWQRYDSRAESWLPIDAPTKVCSGLFELPDYRHLPPLNAIARQPFLRPDGSLVTVSGYDALTGTFGAFNPRKFNISVDPTEVELGAAKDLLLGLLDECSFAAESDKAAAVACFLTAAIRPSLPVAPGFLHNAHAPGSGKSYLQNMTIQFATDGGVSSATYKLNDDEMEKSVLAIYLKSPAVLRFDEAQGDITPIKFVVSALTSETVAGRILGQSKVVEPSTRVLHLFAGNNIQPVGDMVRRIVVCNIDARVENPESRHFNGDPLTLIETNREQYVSAAITLVIGQIRSGMKTEAKPLNGFPHWEKWVRQTVMGLGLTDPCGSMFQAATTDPDAERLAELLRHWYPCFGEYPRGARDLVTAVDTKDNAELRSVLMEIAGKSGVVDPTALGHWIKKNVGKVSGGMRLERHTAKHPTARYFVHVLDSERARQFSSANPGGPSKPSNPSATVEDFADERQFSSANPDSPSKPSNPSTNAEDTEPTRVTRLARAPEAHQENLSDSVLQQDVTRPVSAREFLSADVNDLL